MKIVCTRNLFLLLVICISVPFIIYTKKSSQDKCPTDAVYSLDQNTNTLQKRKKELVQTQISAAKKHMPDKHIVAPHIQNQPIQTAHKSPDTHIKSSEPAQKTVMINNQLSRDMLTYKKHWSGNHTPTQFNITFNGQNVENGTSKSIAVDKDQKIVVRYQYEFKYGLYVRKGGHEIAYKVD